MQTKKIAIGVIVLIVVILVGMQLWRVLSSSSPESAPPETDVTVTPEQPDRSAFDTSTDIEAAEVGVRTLESDVTTEELVEEIAENNTTPTLSSDPVDLSTDEELQISLGKFAESFVERMGSYSADSNYTNLKALYPLMTVDMRNWAKGVVASGGTPSDQTLSIKVNPLSSEVLDLDAESALIVVTTQKEKTALGQSDTVYQRAEVSVLKSGDDWLVNRVDWGEEGVL